MLLCLLFGTFTQYSNELERSKFFSVRHFVNSGMTLPITMRKTFAYELCISITHCVKMVADMEFRNGVLLALGILVSI